MDRYEIILNKPVIPPVVQKEIGKMPDVFPYEYERFRGSKGKEYRIGLVYDNPASVLIGGQVHFFSRYFLCKSIKHNHKEICCTANYKGNTPRWRISLVIAVYPHLDCRGTALPELKNWVIGEATYVLLRGLGEKMLNDLILTCENTEYQKWKVRCLKTSFWKTDVSYNLLQEKAKPLLAKRADYLGLDMTPLEIQNMFHEFGINNLGRIG